ncbi:unnamed protein product [Linum tenue]|uniref:Uncharacterized protein n=1 Tax=Linum tenue TaxID=586396 RepID=A0AAV0M3Q1_9ROSI|nr:unnamed protein product [Linum tenue]
MAPLWMNNVDQKLKLIMASFPSSALTLLFALSLLALAGVVIAILILLVRRSKSLSHGLSRGGSSTDRAMLMEAEHGRATDDDENDDDLEVAAAGGSSWVTIRKVLMSSMRWSEGSRVAEEEIMMISSSSVSSCSSSSQRSCNYRVEDEEIISRVVINCPERTTRGVAPVPEESPVPVQPRGEAAERGGGGGGYVFGWSRGGNWRREKHVGPSTAAAAAAAAVWQRPILMGEKCELPKFSGLILYDERGRPLYDQKELLSDMPLEAKEKKEGVALNFHHC